ncbi:MAG: hypothetical protein JWP59_926 [Massilia sp.]|jgi:hypothetical protein|nr:hypothetical protein [Massilia sp.]
MVSLRVDVMVRQHQTRTTDFRRAQRRQEWVKICDAAVPASEAKRDLNRGCVPLKNPALPVMVFS